MASSDPQDRALIARIAAAERWGRTPDQDRSAATAPARAGLRSKFAHQVDPTGSLPASEVERRVDQLMQAHMWRMSRLAKIARARSRALSDQADAAEAALPAAGGGPDAAA